MAKYSCIFRMPKKVSVFAFRSWLNVLSLFSARCELSLGCLYAQFEVVVVVVVKKSVVVVVVFYYYYYK